ncbi:MAG: L-threonylcarbamoyladenylate synthase [Treponema sp.]
MKYNKSEKDSVDKTSQILKEGGIAIIPTDTVYGFSGIVDLASNKNKYKTDYRIRAIKGRAETKPLIQLISKPNDIYLYTDDKIPESLLKKWPGALTIIVNCKKNSQLADEVATVAFRCPGDKWIRDVIEQTGAPIYSTSVNRSGLPVIDEIKKIDEEFNKEVDLLINDGDKKGALPSTIVSICNGEIKVLRQGSVKI